MIYALPIDVTDKIDLPVDVTDKIKLPVDVIDKIELPVEVTDKIELPVDITDKIELPVGVIDKIKLPVDVVDKIEELGSQLVIIREAPLHILHQFYQQWCLVFHTRRLIDLSLRLQGTEIKLWI